jgi:hypothetical protein
MSNYLEYSNMREHEVLQGSYMSKNSVNGKDCGGGTVYLEKSKPFEKWANAPIEKEKNKVKEKEKNNTLQTDTKPFNKGNETTIVKANTSLIKNKNIVSKTPAGNTNIVSNTVPSSSNNKRKVESKLDTNPSKNTSTTVEKIALVSKKTTNAIASSAQVADQTAAINKTAILNKAEANSNDEMDAQNTSASNDPQQGKNFQVIPWVLVGRENKLVKKIITHNTKISIDLYDNGTIDNDTILVYDNNQLVIDKKRLSYKAIHLDINFNEGNKTHEVIIVAQNMGTVPPNTALLVLKDGNNRQEYFITSTNKMNAKLWIEYVPLTDAAKVDQQ